MGYILAALVLGGVAVAVIMAMIVGAVSDTKNDIAEHSVIEITLRRGMSEQADDGFLGIGGSIAMRSLLAGIRTALRDENVEGIVIRADEIEASGAQLAELRRELVTFKSSQKFVYATISEAGVSEWAYYLASAADSIYMHPIAEIEMNGFVAQVPFFKTAMDRIGVKAEVFKVGRYKSAVEPFLLDSASDDSRANINSIIGDAFGRFKRTISSSRGISEAGLDQVLDSVSFVRSAQAQALHLVDHVVYADEFDATLRRRLTIDSTARIPYVSINDYVRSTEVEGANGSSQIAIVYAVGEISAGESRYDPNPLFGGGSVVGSRTFVEAMREARESKSVKAVVIRIESPGGLMTASDAMWREVELTSRVKPVIASMGSVAASGGYYIAAPSDTIVADSATITGSIGVFGLFFNTHALLSQTLGINLDVIRTNTHADLMSGDRDLTTSERTMIQRMVDASYERFLEVVSMGRGMSRDSVHAVAQGRVWTGSQAKQVGLVDELGGLHRAVEIAQRRAGISDADLGLRILPRHKTKFEQFIEQVTKARAILSEETWNARDQAVARLNEIRRWSGIQLRAPYLEVH